MANNNPSNISELQRRNDAPVRSIYAKFLGLLVPAIVLSAILVLSIYAYFKTSAAEESVIEKLNFIAVSHADSIAHPLWTLDLPELERAMKTIAIYPEILCVNVLDVFDKQEHTWPEGCGLSASKARQYVKSVAYNEMEIGTLTLNYTDEPALAQLRREIVFGAIFFFVLVVVASFVAVASLRSIVGQPLMQLMKSIRTAKKVEDHETIEWSSQDEFGEVISAYNGLIMKVNEKTVELVKAREVAEQANESKGMFLANMSHELRTPLNTVISITEMLREEAEEEKRDTEAFDRVAGSGRHLLSLIDEILQCTKLESDKADVVITKFSLQSLISDVANIARPLSARRNNTLELIVDTKVKYFVSDELKLRQILLNLLQNACKFTDAGNIIFSVSDSRYESQAGILFSVKDTGIGISEDNRDRIFEEFAQVDISTTRQYGGSGLGLAISQRLCNVLGGHITLVSEEEVGAEFSFILPISPKWESGIDALNDS